MKEFLIETHCHTKEISPCSRIPGKELAELYIKAGYDAIVVTDHFNAHLIDFSRGIENEITRHFEGYREAKKAGENRLKVYFGIEFALTGSPNEFLIYGNSLPLLSRGEELFKMNIYELYAAVKEFDLAMFQAHPFRDRMSRAPVNALDGIEVYNLHPNHKSRNYLSVAYACENNLAGISGSDCHEESHCGRGGILIDELPIDENGLKDIILQGDYDLVF